ncbi:MAG: hypothetical protein AAGH15_03545 [Myxococcota bacterium]
MLTILLGLFAGCAGAGEPPPDGRQDMLQLRWTGDEPVTLGPDAFVGRQALDPIHGPPVGIAVQPDTGRRLVLTSFGVLQDLDTEELLPSLEEPNGGALGDIVGLGDGLLAVTGMNDGYLVSTSDGVLRQHFCFLPGWQENDPGLQDPMQLARALGFDAERERLYAQPRMWENGGFGPLTDSFLSSYALSDGADLTWWNMPSTEVEAGGMIVLDAGPNDMGRDAPTLLLSVGMTFARLDGVTGELEPFARIAPEAGILDVAGMAYDAPNDAVLIAAVEADGASVRSLPLAALGL